MTHFYFYFFGRRYTSWTSTNGDPPSYMVTGEGRGTTPAESCAFLRLSCGLLLSKQSPLLVAARYHAIYLRIFEGPS